MKLWDKARDRSVLRGVGHGSEAALWTLYERHSRLIAVRLSRRGASPSEIEDVLQETFLAAWRGADRYRGDGAVAAWLWGIAQRQYALLIRRTIRDEQLPAPPTVDRDPEADWIDHIDAEQFLTRLDPHLRQTVDAVAIHGMSVSEAATHLGIPEGTVKSRMHRVRQLINEEST
ncbi:MAG: RNA polymerase sigma factor [Actinomycetota bacterium]|nr:RNA polymerase sigma factor [Actinomycetota bacterium]